MHYGIYEMVVVIALLWLVGLNIGWDCLRPQCIVGSCDQWEFSPLFKGLWQSPCTALMAGKCLSLGLHQEIVRQSKSQAGASENWAMISSANGLFAEWLTHCPLVEISASNIWHIFHGIALWGPETGIFHDSLFNNMDADALAPCIARSAAALLFYVVSTYSYLPWDRISIMCSISAMAIDRKCRKICNLTLKQGKSEGFDSCDRPSNLTQIGLKSWNNQPAWPWNLMNDLKKQ